ncbi:hypothetical protein ABZP36_002985 [Zizania latifolia]
MMIAALSHSGQVKEDLDVVVEMHSKGVCLDSTTYTSSCARLSYLGWGKKVHAKVIGSLPQIDPYVASALVDYMQNVGVSRKQREYLVLYVIATMYRGQFLLEDFCSMGASVNLLSCSIR